MIELTDSNGATIGHIVDSKHASLFLDVISPITIIDTETGEIKTLTKQKTAYQFPRRLVSVRVHDDDRQMILDTADALNQARRQV